MIFMDFHKYLKRIKKINKHKLFLWGIGTLVAGAVFILLLFVNFGFLNVLGFFENHQAYADSIILFSHSECSYCTKVDTYLAANKIGDKLDIVRLDVDNRYNENILEDKVQTCGLDINKIGVPFLWYGPEKKCVIGYVDIINFFKQKIVKGAK